MIVLVMILGAIIGAGLLGIGYVIGESAASSAYRERWKDAMAQLQASSAARDAELRSLMRDVGFAEGVIRNGQTTTAAPSGAADVGAKRAADDGGDDGEG